jgi:hypothetical protein
LADTLQIGTFNSTFTAFTSSLDLNSGNVQLVRDTFKVQAPERRAQFSDSNRRYGGAWQSSEQHGNGAVGGSFLISNASATTAIDKWESLLQVIEGTDDYDYYIKWQPEAATYPVYYEVRGAASWAANYRWIEFSQNRSVVFDVQWPVGPLARGAAITFSTSSASYPATVQIPNATGYSVSVPGTAPALMDLNVIQAASSTGIDFFSVAWTKRPGSPVTSTNTPFGLIEVSTGTAASTGVSGTNYTFNNTSPNRVAIASPATSTTYTLNVDIDPSVLVRDDFTRNEIQLEVFGRIKVASTHSATVVTSLEPKTATGASSRYTAEYGTSGKILAAPSSSSGFYMYKLGTLTAVCEAGSPSAVYTLRLTTTFSAASTSEFAIDYLMVQPSRQRALTPTGKTPDSTYPKFLYSTAAATKTIQSDLKGWLTPSGGTRYPDSGLGGQMLELPPGNVDLFIKPTLGVPDNTTTADDETKTLTVSGTIIPRYYLARGT